MLDVLRLLMQFSDSSFHLYTVHFPQHPELNIPPRYNYVSVFILSKGDNG